MSKLNVVTASSRGEPNPECVAAFEKSARWGRGECELFVPKGMQASNGRPAEEGQLLRSLVGRVTGPERRSLDFGGLSIHLT